MKHDKNGCSTCPRGQEQYEDLTDGSRDTIVAYEYRDWDGELFSTVVRASTFWAAINMARSRRDCWVDRKQAKATL